MVHPKAPMNASPGHAGTAARKALALVSAATLAFTACMQTDPEDPALPDPVIAPEDNGRRAGASSSTNWPTELVGRKQSKIFWIADSSLRLPFIDFPETAPAKDFPVKRTGTVRLYPGGTIPALDSLSPIHWDFQDTDTLEIPKEKIEALEIPGRDTILFNIQVDCDSLVGWLSGFSYSRKEGRILQAAPSLLPENPAYMKKPEFYFQGSYPDVAALLPPATGKNPELGFYIPGTPEFCVAKPDSFKVGPLPKGNYPLRIMRLSSSQDPTGGTLVEAWELRTEIQGTTSVFKLGEQVLTYQAKGKLSLRSDE